MRHGNKNTEPAAYGRRNENVYTRPVSYSVSDLDQFRNDLLKEFEYLLSQKHSAPEKQWLKSSDVRKPLKISSVTLQHLRETGRLRFSKVGGIIYYQHEDIQSMLENG